MKCFAAASFQVFASTTMQLLLQQMLTVQTVPHPQRLIENLRLLSKILPTVLAFIRNWHLLQLGFYQKNYGIKLCLSCMISMHCSNDDIIFHLKLSFCILHSRSMIEISLWRARIGQFAHSHHRNMSLRLVLGHRDGRPSRPSLVPVCVLVIAAVLLMGGDIEQNPGPKRKSGQSEITVCTHTNIPYSLKIMEEILYGWVGQNKAKMIQSLYFGC